MGLDPVLEIDVIADDLGEFLGGGGVGLDFFAQRPELGGLDRLEPEEPAQEAVYGADFLEFIVAVGFRDAHHQSAQSGAFIRLGGGFLGAGRVEGKEF